VIEGPLTWPYPRESDRGEGERHDVLIALARAEDEEAVAPVVGDPGDDHRADDAAARQRGRQAEQQQAAGPELGDAGGPRVQHARSHAEAFEPAGGADDLAAAEDVVVAVRREHHAQADPEHQQ
jgi:hypothetical protein